MTTDKIEALIKNIPILKSTSTINQLSRANKVRDLRGEPATLLNQHSP